MSEATKNSASAFMDYNEYTKIKEERAGAILAFRAGEDYDFYGQDVDEMLGSKPSLIGKATALKLPDGSSVEHIRMSREEVYANLEALLDYSNGMLGLVFLDKPNEPSQTEYVSITSAYDKWFDLSVNNGGVNVLLRNNQFQTYGKDSEKVNELLGITKEVLSEDIFASEFRHNISELPKLQAMEEEVNTYDYSGYVQASMQKEKSLMDKLAQQTSIISSKQIIGSDGELTYNDEIAKVVNDRRQKVYERQAELLSNALSKGVEGGSAWLNQNYKEYPQVFYSASQKPVTPSPFHALMMCLHSDAEDSVYNDYTTYYAAKSAGTPVISGEHGVPLVFDTTVGYINKENKSDTLSKEEYLFLPDAEKGKFERITTTGIQTMFNIDQTADIAVRDEVFYEENGRPPIKNYEGFTEEERNNLQMRFNGFLSKMNDNLVKVDLCDKGSFYSKTKDLVLISYWQDVKENIRRGENDYPYYMQHSIRQIVEATGSEQRLNRLARLERNGDISKEDAQKQEELIVEIASAVKMLEFGLPGELTPWSRLKDIDYWKKELKENPQLIGTLEKEVNSSLRMIKKAENGESIKLKEKVAETRNDADSYYIASQLREDPCFNDAINLNVICVIDRKRKTADVIFPWHVDLPDTPKDVEENQTIKGVSSFLSGQGITDIKYYKQDSKNYYGPNDSSFKGKEIFELTIADNKVISDIIMDASSLKEQALDRHLNRADMLKDVNGNWTFMMDFQYNFAVNEWEDPIFVHPEKGDLRRYFSTMKVVPDKLPELRKTLAQKYLLAVMKNPNLNINPFEVNDESLDVSRIKKAYIYTNKEGDIMCRPQIEGVDNIEERKMSVSQWKLLWLADNTKQIRKSLAAVLYADILKQEIVKEQTQEVKEEQQVAVDVDDKVFKSVTFEGQEYQCRVVEDAEGNSLLIASTELLDKLQPYSICCNGLGGYVSEEARAIDKRIFYYTAKDSLYNLNNEELVAILAKVHPKIFKMKEKTEDLDKKDLYPMLKQYNSLKQKHPDAILLFRMGDFYEAYQDDAQVAAKILDIALTQRRDKNGGSVQMAGFPYHALDTYLPKLIKAGERVAICDPKPIEKITPAQKVEAQEEVAEAETESRQHSMRR